jgi:hypothetical protein
MDLGIIKKFNYKQNKHTVLLLQNTLTLVEWRSDTPNRFSLESDRTSKLV